MSVAVSFRSPFSLTLKTFTKKYWFICYFITIVTMIYVNQWVSCCCRHKGYLTDMENDADPELMLEILTRLGQTIMRANDLEKWASTESSFSFFLSAAISFACRPYIRLEIWPRCRSTLFCNLFKCL